MAIIKKCTCEHAFQDQRYGPKLRVHTTGKEGDRCTVCHVKTYGMSPSIYQFSTRVLRVIGKEPNSWKAIRV